MKYFRNRFALRFHMFAILAATACTGVLASKILHYAGLDTVIVRYPLAVIVAYLFFFLCIKLWLIYVVPSENDDGSRVSDWLDLPNITGGGSGSGGGNVSTFSPGGGQFGGGGASSSFNLNAVPTANPGSAINSAASETVKGLGETAGDAVGRALGDEGGFALLAVVIALIALVATVLGSAAYLVYEAPMILSEAAFEGLLAASLIKSVKTMKEGDWTRSIFASTWKPFLLTLVMALIAGGVLNYYFPEATRITDVFKMG